MRRRKRRREGGSFEERVREIKKERERERERERKREREREKRDRNLFDDVDHVMRYLSILGKKRYPRFLAESRNVLDDRLSTLICQPSTSVESTGSHISSLKLDRVADDAEAASILAIICNQNEFTATFTFPIYHSPPVLF